MTYRLISVSDQALPCSVDWCPNRARFRITPTCTHTESDWPTRQACGRHVSNVLLEASAKCKGHFGGSVVRVRTL